MLPLVLSSSLAKFCRKHSGASSEPVGTKTAQRVGSLQTARIRRTTQHNNDANEHNRGRMRQNTDFVFSVVILMCSSIISDSKTCSFSFSSRAPARHRRYYSSAHAITAAPKESFVQLGQVGRSAKGREKRSRARSADFLNESNSATSALN